MYCLCLQNDNDLMESVIELTNVTRLGTKATPSDFELLKVLGQGSFGKVRHLIMCERFFVYLSKYKMHYLVLSMGNLFKNWV